MNEENTSTAVVATASEVPVGSLRMVRVGGRRLVLVHTAQGFSALDNACPHEGYGLAQGNLVGQLLTCEWHNWKFDVTDGSCVLGEESVRSHAVDVINDQVTVTVSAPDPAALKCEAFASLAKAIDNGYDGQIARDCLRLLHAGVQPVEIVWAAIARTTPRTEFGWDHALAMTTDCLLALSDRVGDDRLLPIAQAVSAMAESELRRPQRKRPSPLDQVDLASETNIDIFGELVEAEAEEKADALLSGALHAGLPRDAAAQWLIRPVCAHHLAFGHGAIYVQKAFEMLDIVGWHRAADVLPHVSCMIVHATREDRLPYMRPFMKVLDNTDLDELLNGSATQTWTTEARDELVGELIRLEPVQALQAALAAMRDGAGIEHLLDAVAIGASERMLRHDLAHEHAPDISGYGWLDITHSLTYANAARWAWREAPGSGTARLALFTVFHLADSLRYANPDKSLSQPTQDPDDAMVSTTLNDPLDNVAAALIETSLDDRSGALIVVAHHVKVARAAIRETQSTGSRLPVAAAARFLTAPARQRFVSNSVQRARHFLTTGSPPPR